MKRNKWNEERLALLAELYPVETTPHTACVLGMSETAVKNMARRLGIAKRAKRKDTGRAGHIQAHFHERSFSEMAESLGISKTTVWRTASRLGLERTDAQHKDILSRTRREMIRRERRRAVFGLEPLTRIKVVTDRARVKLRSLLKSKGYVVDGGERNTLYFTAGTERLERLERRGERHGLRFLPFPCTDFLPYRPLTIKKHTAMQYGQIVFSLFTCLVIYYAVMAASDILKAKAAQSADGEGRDEEDIDISDEARTFKPVTVSRDEPEKTVNATDNARPPHRPGHREAAMTDGILVEDLMEEVNRLAESGHSDLGQVIFACENAM